MKTQLSRWLVALATLFTLGSQLSTARASVIDVVWYRLGENDPGAVSGVTATNATDLIGFENLKQFGSPIYTNAVSAGASNNIASSLAVQFNGTNQFLSNSIVSSATDNFGIEAWVKPGAAVGGQVSVIAFNGVANGWGIYQNGSTCSGLLGSVATVGSGAAAVGTWTHLALVRANGTATFYVNGVPSGSTTTSAPLTPTTGFAVGNTALANPNQFFNGAIDEVRVFTIPVLGGVAQFSTNDLLINLRRVTTQAATPVNSNSAQFNGQLNPPGLNTAAWFEWGATTSYGNVTPAQSFGAAAGATNFTQSISGLVAGATYHFHAAVSNSLGVAYASNQSFTTPVPPTVVTLPASAVDNASATLNGTVNPNGTPTAVWFEWGLTTNYGSVTAQQAMGNGSSNTNFSQGISGLSGGITYNFHAVASNGVGVATGGNQAFTTTPSPPYVVTLPPVFNQATSFMEGSVSPRGSATTVWFEWGPTTNLGLTTAFQNAGSGSATNNYGQYIEVDLGTSYFFRAAASNQFGTAFGDTLKNLLRQVVWINELDPVKSSIDSDPGSNEYVELAGFTGVDITGWKLEMIDQNTNTYATYAFPPGSVLHDQTNLHGFFLIGSPGMSPDVAFTNSPIPNEGYIADVGAMRLYDASGVVQQAIVYDTNGSSLNLPGFTYVGEDTNNNFISDPGIDGSIGLVGSGAYLDRFTWTAEVQNLSPRTPNIGQLFVGPDYSDVPPTLPTNVFITHLNFGPTNTLRSNGKFSWVALPEYVTNLAGPRTWRIAPNYSCVWSNGTNITTFTLPTNTPAALIRLEQSFFGN